MNNVIDTVEKKNEILVALRNIHEELKAKNEELKKENERLEKKYELLSKQKSKTSTKQQGLTED